ncbi:MAG: DUF2066 domain-containing protein [Amphritea sp.]
MVFAVRYTLLGLFCICFSALSQAATVRDLYSAELIVPEQLSQPSDEQLRQGLQRVLVKVSGRSNVVSIPQVSSALNNPAELIQQFGYQSTQTPVSAGDGREVLGQQLQLDFDPVLINRLLQRSGLRALGHARPNLMVWLVAQEGNAGRDFLPPEGSVYSQLAEFGKQRGLPLEVPLLDLTDQQTLDVSDLWGFFRQPIEQASQRYQPDAILAGRLYRHPNGVWETQWLLINASQTRNLSPAGMLANQLEDVIDQAADLMLGQMGGARMSYVEEGLKLEVSNVDGIDDFLQLLEYTRNLPPVESALPGVINDDRVILRVKIQGNVDTLEQAIHLNPRLASTSRINADNGQPQVLVYRWQE